MVDERLGSLRVYQQHGVSFLSASSAALLADEMGLGKTVQAAVALQTALLDPRARALVVVPAALRLNWLAELDAWVPSLSVRAVTGSLNDRRAYFQLPARILVASYEQIRSDWEWISHQVEFEVVILDEAQRIKNIESSTSLACRLLARRRSWTLTGTPVENSVSDLLAIFSFVKPGLLREGMTRSEIHARMRPYFLRRRKTDVFEALPPILEQTMPVELQSRQRDAYDRILGQRLAIPRGSSYAALLGLITRLKVACNFEPLSGESAKLEVLATLLEDAASNSHKVIVFSQFVGTLEFLCDHLLVGSRLFLYHGEMDAASRDASLKAFRSSTLPAVLLMSIRAGGVGLNIPEASVIVLLDRWWNPAVESQAIARADRFGRREPLVVYKLLTADTIEERIVDIVERKQSIFEDYVEDAPSTEKAVVPSRAELEDILGIGLGHET